MRKRGRLGSPLPVLENALPSQHRSRSLQEDNRLFPIQNERLPTITLIIEPDQMREHNKLRSDLPLLKTDQLKEFDPK